MSSCNKAAGHTQTNKQTGKLRAKRTHHAVADKVADADKLIVADQLVIVPVAFQVPFAASARYLHRMRLPNEYPAANSLAWGN